MITLTNHVQLIGRLGDDPEMKTMKNNRKLARMRIATSEEYVNKSGEKIREVQWHNLILWDNLAEECMKSLSRGHEIAVAGKLGYRSYLNNFNERKYFAEISVTDLKIISDVESK